MPDKIVYGVAETGTYLTTAPTPHVDLDGSSPSNVSIAQLFADALSDQETATITVRKDADNWACYGHATETPAAIGAEFDSGQNRLSLESATLRDSKGTLSNGDSVDVIAEYPEPGVDDVPVDGATTVPVSSNWAFDFALATNASLSLKWENGETIKDYLLAYLAYDTSGDGTSAIQLDASGHRQWGECSGARLFAYTTSNPPSPTWDDEEIGWELILDYISGTPTFTYQGDAFDTSHINFEVGETYWIWFKANDKGRFITANKISGTPPSAGGGWVQGTLVEYNINGTQIITAPGSYSIVDNQTCRLNPANSGIYNFTTPAIGVADSYSFDIIINSASFTPVIHINGALPTFSQTLPTFTGTKRYRFSLFADETESILTWAEAS